MQNDGVHLIVPKDLADFIVANCDKNILYSVSALGSITDRKTLEALVDLIEKFKNLKEITQKAIGIPDDAKSSRTAIY